MSPAPHTIHGRLSWHDRWVARLRPNQDYDQMFLLSL